MLTTTMTDAKGMTAAAATTTIIVTVVKTATLKALSN
ncbi:MAG: hypothetical protein ACI945_001516 [Pseudohongiellaceae bacterium]|jgi:hypothetical protein